MAAITNALEMYSGNPHLAEEACAESVAKLYEYGIERVHNLRSWLLHVGRNYIKDHYRRKSTRLTVSLSHVADAVAQNSNKGMSAESRTAIRSALTQLSDSDQAILLMKYSLRWNSQRIGIVLGVRVTAVDMQLVRARRRLAALLTEQANCQAD